MPIYIVLYDFSYVKTLYCQTRVPIAKCNKHKSKTLLEISKILLKLKIREKS